MKLLVCQGIPQGKGHIVRAPQGSGVDSGKDTAQHEGHSGVQRAHGVAAADGYACPPAHDRPLAFSCWHSPPARSPWAKGSLGLQVAAARGVNASPLSHPCTPCALSCGPDSRFHLRRAPPPRWMAGGARGAASSLTHGSERALALGVRASLGWGGCWDPSPFLGSPYPPAID